MIRTPQSGDPQWEIGLLSDRSSPPQTELLNNQSPILSASTTSSSSSSSTVRPLRPATQTKIFSLNPLAPSFNFVGRSSFFLPPSSTCLPPPPAFENTSSYIYQQQVIDRQQTILTSINKWNTSATMAPFSLPTGQPAPNAFQFNNNIPGFPPSLSSLQNTSQDSATSNDSFRTQVPKPWDLPSEYENTGQVAIPDPSPFADPPIPFATPNFNNGLDARAQFQPFANQNSMMNGTSAGAYGNESEYQMPGQQQQQGYPPQNSFNMRMNRMNGMRSMNGMNGMNGTNGMHGMNGFDGANDVAYQPPPYNGPIGGPQNPQMGNGHLGNQQHQLQNQLAFNGHGASAQSNFAQQNMGMRPQLPQIATQFPSNQYSTQYNQTYSAPPIGGIPQQFYNGGGGDNNYHGPNSTPGSASSMMSNLNFGNLSLGNNTNSIGPNGNQNNGYGHSNGIGGNAHQGLVQNQTSGISQAVAHKNNNNNIAAIARNAQYSSLPPVGNIQHPLPPKPQFHAQKPFTSKPDHGNHVYAAINSNPHSAHSGVHTPQQQKSSLQSEQSQQSQQSSNSIQSPVSSNDFPISATASEPRARFTPLLRSTRGKSIKSITASVDRAQHVEDWVQNTPTRGSISRESSIAGEVIIDDTSKMSNFNTRGLELTPSSSFTPRPLSVNPFGPSNDLMPLSTNNRFAPAMSALLRELTENGTVIPTAEKALDMHYMPLEEYCRQSKPAQWGVMKIKNIPYGVTRQEILAFLGRNAKIAAADDHEPIHIIMERVTSKTLDAFVEFISFSEAANAVQRFDMNRMGGRGGRLGQRHVEVELSSQEELMKQLFPKAKNVEWQGNRPKIIDRDENDMYNSGFKGFVSSEELVMLVKHVESPQRSPFSKECPQRPFECLVSTLCKFPWSMVNHITCENRADLYNATMKLLRLLVERVDSGDDLINLNSILLKRVWRTALKCEGFSPTMKDNIVFEFNIDPSVALEIGVPPQADMWSYVWTIGPRKDVGYDLVQYYAKLIVDATAEKKQLTLAEKAAARAEEVPKSPDLFGNLHKFIDHSDAMKLTLAEVAEREWAAFETAIRKALTPALPALEAGPSTQ